MTNAFFRQATAGRAVVAVVAAATLWLVALSAESTQAPEPQAGRAAPQATPGIAKARSGLAGASAPARSTARAQVSADGTITSAGRTFAGWPEYASSAFFQHNGRRCGTLTPRPERHVEGIAGNAGDCSYDFTNPSAEYDPAIVKYRIPVVVHVIQRTSGQGYLSPSTIQSQIDVLNEDYLALASTLGQNGTDVQIEFYLAATDPSGNPTTGITYTANNAWFDHTSTGFFAALKWDPFNYLNIYTNTAGGFLGYSSFPQTGDAGTTDDGIVILYSVFGRNAPIGPPYHKGRTVTHEVGHYLGLFHTFANGCGTALAPGCLSTGDRICDTNSEATHHFGCPAVNSCTGDAGADPVDNYMNYTDDLCMKRFTLQQARRMRCTLEQWRPSLYEIVLAPSACPADITGDDAVDVNDLLLLIGGWGACPAPPASPCPANLNGDNAVDVNDLLLLIGAWGPCP